MTKAEFELIFDNCFSQPLIESGFERRGMSLFYNHGVNQIGLIRGAGRLSVPGVVSFILGFRHSFLRDNLGNTPKKQAGAAEHYPWLMGLDELSTQKDQWIFSPEKSSQFPFKKIYYDNLKPSDLKDYFLTRSKLIVEDYLPWVLSIELDQAQQSMQSFASDWWIARQWEEDYIVFGKEGNKV